MKQTLALPLGGEVKEQDIYLPISGLRSHPEGIEALFAWMQDNWDELARRLPAGLSILSSMVAICTNGFTSEKDRAHVEKFFSERSTKGFEMGLAQSLESISAKAAWLGRDREDVAAWVKDNGYSSKNIKSEL
jgi:aminopeptidase 2